MSGGSIEVISVSHNFQTLTHALSKKKGNRNHFHKAARKARWLARIFPVIMGQFKRPFCQETVPGPLLSGPGLLGMCGEGH